MFKNFVEQIPVSETLAITSLLIFFLVFVGIIYFTMKTDKSYREKMKHLPLDSSQSNGEHING
jgi:hypothetical protein